ncbi:MAG: DUF1579 family protein [Candidatus Polarisedimenticolia bacterium]
MRRAGWIAAAALGAASCLAGIPAHAAASADTGSILSRHAQARGGKDAWKVVTSLEVTGTQISFSVPNPFTLQRQRPNLHRFEQTQLKRPVIEVFDGSHAWWINGLMGTEWPLAAPEPAAGFIARDAAFDTPLLGHPENGAKVTAFGPEDFEGQPAWRLEVELKGGGKETWYLDPATGLEIARVATTSDFGEIVEKRWYFSDFRKAGSLVLPHRIETEYGSRNEVLEVKEVRVNPAIDSARFTQPLPEGMDVLAGLAGDWNMTIETRAFPRAPWQPHQASSVIKTRLANGLLEESYSHVDQGQAIDVLRTWSYDRFHKTYRVTQADSIAFQQIVLQGEMKEGRLVLSNETTGTS